MPNSKEHNLPTSGFGEKMLVWCGVEYYAS